MYGPKQVSTNLLNKSKVGMSRRKSNATGQPKINKQINKQTGNGWGKMAGK